MPVVLKEGQDRFRVLDPFYAGEWVLDCEALMSYLAFLGSLRTLAFDDSVRLPGGHDWPDAPEPMATFLRHGLPLACDFDLGKVAVRAEEIERGIVTPPIPVFEVTPRCNYRCPWCYVPRNQPKPMALDAIRRNLVAPLIRRGTRLFVLTGGEPATDLRRLTAVCELVGTEGQKAGSEVQISLLTNGYRLRSNARLYCDLGIRTIQVSIISARGSLDQRLRHAPAGCNSAEEAFLGVEAAIQGGIAVSLNFVLLPALADCPSNIEEIPDMVERAHRLGVYLIRIVPVVPSGEAARAGIRLGLRELKQARELIADARRRWQDQRLIIYSPIADDVPPSKPVYCRAGNDVLYVNAEGWTYPCNNLICPEFRCSDVPLDRQDVLDVWDHSQVLERFRRPAEPCAGCRACDLRAECGGQCRAQLFWRNNQPDLRQVPAACLKRSVA
jgi:radical SAM protein with 4Fe4S-binding SPASM domain